MAEQHPLTAYYKSIHDLSREHDAAADTATELLVTAGYEYEMHDAFGEEVNEDVQTLLMAAFMRAPMLMDLIRVWLDEHNIDKEYSETRSTCSAVGPPEASSACILRPDHPSTVEHQDDSGGTWPMWP